MSPSTAPFEHSFDSIEVSASTAPSREAIERALAMCAPAHDEGGAGFYLLDNAGGRLIVDRESGVISLKDEALLVRELGRIHAARLKVIEPSGTSYELELRLRITGLVPQVLGCERDAAIFAGDPEPNIAEPDAPVSHWTRFSPAAGGCRKPSLGALSARFGALLDSAPQPLQAASARFERTNATIAPSSDRAAWSF